MMKKFLSMILAAAMLLTLAACSNNTKTMSRIRLVPPIRKRIPAKVTKTVPVRKQLPICSMCWTKASWWSV